MNSTRVFITLLFVLVMGGCVAGDLWAPRTNPDDNDDGVTSDDDDATKEEESTPDPAYEDGDGDGQSQAQGDCDDFNPYRYYGADEVCDGIDNDCNGVVGASEVDGDHDGVMVCYGDCDDADASVHPYADEVCDGVDSDCSGALALSETDSDGDGSVRRARAIASRATPPVRRRARVVRRSRQQLRRGPSRRRA